MRVVSIRPLRDFWSQPGRADGEQPLRTWFNVACKARWTSIGDVKADYPSVDWAHGLYVFDIKGNTYRLLCAIDFARHGVLVQWVGTHADYDALMRHDGRKLRTLLGEWT